MFKQYLSRTETKYYTRCN